MILGIFSKFFGMFSSKTAERIGEAVADAAVVTGTELARTEATGQLDKLFETATRVQNPETRAALLAGIASLRASFEVIIASVGQPK